MAIVETSWKRLLSPDSEIPPDIFFLVKREEGGNYSGKPIGAHKIFLAGVSTVFMRMFFGLLKETREVIEVRGTTSEAFTTMIDYIFKPPGRFFPDYYDDVDFEDDYDEDNDE